MTVNNTHIHTRTHTLHQYDLKLDFISVSQWPRKLRKKVHQFLSHPSAVVMCLSGAPESHVDL